MIQWIFAIIVVLAALAATGARTTRSAVLALWICGVSCGALFLTLGAELLAVVQWILSTLTAISFVFFSVTFGEYEAKPKAQRGRPPVAQLVAGAIIGVVFAATLWLGLGPVPQESLAMPREGNDLVSLGKKLVVDNFISVQVIGLFLLVALVGGGAVARPRRPEPGGDEC